MNIKLIAFAAAAFVLGHDIAVNRANRRAEKMQPLIDDNERGDIALRWFQAGHAVALTDKEAVAKAFNKMYPAPPAHTPN